MLQIREAALEICSFALSGQKTDGMCGERLDEEEERRRMRKETNSCREGSKGARV